MKLILLVCFWLVASAAYADGDVDLTAAWFQALTPSDKVAVQTQLLLTQEYSGMVDGKFGPGTYGALLKFQADHGFERSGLLSQAALNLLSQLGKKAYDQYGVDEVDDSLSGLGTIIPTAVLTSKSTSEGKDTYQTADGTIAFSFHGLAPTGATTHDLSLALQKPQEGTTVTYVLERSDRLVISGVSDGLTYYTFFTSVPAGLAGFSVAWSPEQDSMGTMIAALSASYAEAGDARTTSVDPTPDTVASPLATLVPYNSKGERVGDFLLPDSDPSVIVLDGDIKNNDDLDFIRALKKRPGVKSVLLNSGGGYVHPALLIAHQIFDRHLTTKVPVGHGCYSACSYLFFAGPIRVAYGELGVHQLYGDDATAETAQTTLSDVLDALSDFGVSQEIISIMLRTPPESMHVFTQGELDGMKVNRLAQVIEPTSKPETIIEPSTKPLASSVPAPLLHDLGSENETVVAERMGTTAGTVERIVPVIDDASLRSVLLANGFTDKMVDAVQSVFAGHIPSFRLKAGMRLSILFGASRSSSTLIPYRVSIYDGPGELSRHLASAALSDNGTFVMGSPPTNPFQLPQAFFNPDGAGKTDRGRPLDAANLDTGI